MHTTTCWCYILFTCPLHLILWFFCHRHGRMFEGSRLGIQVSRHVIRHAFFYSLPLSGPRTLRPPCGASIGVLRPRAVNVPVALVAVMAVTKNATAVATAREIGTVTVIRIVTVRGETGKGIGTRIGIAGIATVMCATRKGMTNVVAGAPTASVACPRHLSRRKIILGPHFRARVKILACRPPAWIKKSCTVSSFVAEK